MKHLRSLRITTNRLRKTPIQHHTPLFAFQASRRAKCYSNPSGGLIDELIASNCQQRSGLSKAATNYPQECRLESTDYLIFFHWIPDNRGKTLSNSARSAVCRLKRIDARHTRQNHDALCPLDKKHDSTEIWSETLRKKRQIPTICHTVPIREPHSFSRRVQ